MSVPYNSFCIDTEDTTLGAGCDASCANVFTNIVAIMDAGAAHFHVCPPAPNPTAPCRATSNGGVELFRFQPGGLGRLQGQLPRPASGVRRARGLSR
jgi:hypothetical protein